MRAPREPRIDALLRVSPDSAHLTVERAGLGIDSFGGMTHQLADPLWRCLLDLFLARAANELRIIPPPPVPLRHTARAVGQELLECVNQRGHTQELPDRCGDNSV